MTFPDNGLGKGIKEETFQVESPIISLWGNDIIHCHTQTCSLYPQTCPEFPGSYLFYILCFVLGLLKSQTEYSFQQIVNGLFFFSPIRLLKSDFDVIITDCVNLSQKMWLWLCIYRIIGGTTYLRKLSRGKEKESTKEGRWRRRKTRRKGKDSNNRLALGFFF